MVQRRQRERSLFEVLLPDGHKLWPDWLRKIDTLLEDEAVIEVVAQALEARWPQSRRRGRPGTPAEVVIRMLILKHLFDWSYDDLEREVRANLVYRMFTRIDAGDVPDAKTILKIARALGPEIIQQLHRQVVEVAKRAGVTHGRRFRVDTTVVETNVHYPTDSTLLQDGVRVLTRTLQRASTALGDQAGRIRNRLRSVTRRVLIIGYEARSPKTRAAMIKSYRTLMATTRAVLRDTATMVRRLGQRARTASRHLRPILQRAQDGLSAMRPVVQRVVDQTRARVLGGDTHVPDKVLSLFERHTVTIRKGKIAKPNEFGNLVTIQEAEHQIVTAFPTSRCGPRRWIGIRRSSGVPRIWPRAIAASARPVTNRRRLTAAFDVWCCRDKAPSRRHGAAMSVNAGSAAGNAGASAAKVASVCSNVVMVCAAVATRASTGCTDGSDSASSRTI
jgi:Transposase domain (DUF772)